MCFFPFIVQEKKLLLDKNGPRVARISVFEVCNELNVLVSLYSSFVEEVFFCENKLVMILPCGKNLSL